MSTSDGEPGRGTPGDTPDEVEGRAPGTPPTRPSPPTPPVASMPGALNWGAGGDGPGYLGPPPTTPPPPGWRPPTVVQPLPPRELPPQDPEAIDRSERAARTLTYGIGMIAGAVLLILACLLCSRLVLWS